MPTANVINPIYVESLKDFVSAVEEASQHSDQLWFRGTGDESYNLQPSLYRRKDLHSATEFMDIENKMFDWFSHRSKIFIDNIIEDSREIYFILQHYKVPTRLLDWTENPFIALFFALSGAIKNETDCAVWVLSPIDWNKQMFSGISLTEIPSFRHDVLVSYLERERLKGGLIQQNPLTFFGSHNNKRIAAQRGVFVVFGSELSPMEETFKASAFNRETLKKIVVKKDKVKKLFSSVNNIGYTGSVIYPDLDGLAEEICYKFGYVGS